MHRVCIGNILGMNPSGCAWTLVSSPISFEFGRGGVVGRRDNSVWANAVFLSVGFLECGFSMMFGAAVEVAAAGMCFWGVLFGKPWWQWG